MSDLAIETYAKIGGHGEIVRKLYEVKLTLPDIRYSSFHNADGVHYSHAAIVARLNGEIIGIISYDHIEYNQSIFIYSGWVDPAHRRKGIYRQLFGKLREIAVEKGVLRIQGATAYTNTDMQDVIEKLGRRPVAIFYEMDV
ncbi:GNAT family N-acetyltransferase [Rhizobium rhizogenes]|uniref:GNAT family N-acetyltransferase n=1 Tax=Rhizobium rhizogenes TaxID=359 RepID=UPI001572FECA|nr:GNAT family N-acetyltransferase [Rhizobium rhizogenes]NTG07248.1 GNAT family N-acetyltransferase [Rhizobium rhizogenes]